MRKSNKMKRFKFFFWMVDIINLLQVTVTNLLIIKG